MTKKQIIENINDYFETPKDADDWWQKYNEAFSCKPTELLKTKDGRQRLERMVWQINTGELL